MRPSNPEQWWFCPPLSGSPRSLSNSALPLSLSRCWFSSPWLPSILNKQVEIKISEIYGAWNKKCSRGQDSGVRNQNSESRKEKKEANLFSAWLLDSLLSRSALRAMQIDYSHYQETTFEASSIPWGYKIVEEYAFLDL